VNVVPLFLVLLALVQPPQFDKPSFAPPSPWSQPNVALYRMPHGYPVARLWMDGASSVLWLVKGPTAKTPVTPATMRSHFLHTSAQARIQYGELSVTAADGCPGAVWLRYDEFTLNTHEEVLYLQHDARFAEIRYSRPVGVEADSRLVARMLHYCNALMAQR
jgi:hypothetical protein